MSGMTAFTRFAVALAVFAVSAGALLAGVNELRDGVSFADRAGIVAAALALSLLLGGGLGLASAWRLVGARRDALALWLAGVAVVVAPTVVSLLLSYPDLFDPQGAFAVEAAPVARAGAMALAVLTGLVAWASRHRSAKG